MRLSGQWFTDIELALSGYSDLRYDVNGHLIGAIDTVGNRRFTYVADAQGLVLNRSEIAGNSVNRVQRYYYVDGKRVGDVGNDGPSRMDYVSAMASRGTDKKAYKNWRPIASADFDQNYEPISPTYPGPTASSYTVRNGDTLQSIASTVWGDSAMWYLLADANGLGSNETLSAGQVLTIPNKVTNIHNNSGTFRPYNAGESFSIEPVPYLSPEQALRSPEKILYVLKEDGALVIARTNSDNLFGHFDLAKGENILAGGEGGIYSGQVKSLDNASGHYLPEGQSARDAAVNAFRDA